MPTFKNLPLEHDKKMPFAFLSNARVLELDMHARAAEDNLYLSSVQALYTHAQLYQHKKNKTIITNTKEENENRSSIFH